MSTRIFLVLAFSIFLAGCKKEHIMHHYTGNFAFTIHYIYNDINGNHADTTYVHHGKIYIYSGNAASQVNTKKPVFLKLEFDSNYALVEEVMRDGTFVTDTYLHGEFAGAFSDDDNLKFHVSDGGLGGGYTDDVTGTRE